MKKNILLFIIICTLFSCKEKTEYRTQILLGNSTDNKLFVKLYPKPAYLHDDRFYDYFEGGGGDYKDKEYDIEPGSEECLYISSNASILPHELALKIFDSIHVRPFNEDKIKMKFSPDSVIGYSKNLFKSNSTWSYEKKNYNERTNFNKNPIESNDYTFVISQEKY